MAYGYADPGAFDTELNAISFIVTRMMAKMDTMKPVKVKTVHGGGVAAAGTVDVIPLVSQVDGNGYGTPHGIVYGIPWSRVQGGKAAIICDPVAGDIGYVIAADRDTSVVRATGAAGLPGSGRTFDISDGIYAGACFNQAAPTTYIQFKADGGLKFVDGFGNVIETSSTGIAITPGSGLPVTVTGNMVVTGALQLGGSIVAQNGTTYTGNIVTSGNVSAGNVIANPGASQVTLLSHIHSALNAAPVPGH
jgi:hypothetical protein